MTGKGDSTEKIWKQHEANEALGFTGLQSSQCSVAEFVIPAASDEKHHMAKEIHISY